jgi:hypothetical protein
MKKDKSERRRLTLAESFLGFHCDFHAATDKKPIGGRPFAADLAKMLRAAKQDVVQCDCKAHPRVSSYPTNLGNPPRRFMGGALRVRRGKTARSTVPFTLSIGVGHLSERLS